MLLTGPGYRTLAAIGQRRARRGETCGEVPGLGACAGASATDLCEARGAIYPGAPAGAGADPGRRAADRGLCAARRTATRARQARSADGLSRTRLPARRQA